MRLSAGFILATLAACIVMPALPSDLIAQETPPGTSVAINEEPPETPQPQFALVQGPQTGQSEAGQSQNPPQPVPATTPAQTPASQTPAGPTPAAAGSSSPQPPAAQSGTEKSQHEKAEEQIKEQEKQRVVGVLPQFNISYRADAVSMTAGQKMRLAFRSSIDPVTFGAAILVAGYHEALNDDTGFGWGAEGFGKRSGAAYLDAFDGTIIGNGIFPAILHQDPRYFRLGHGTTIHRLLYSLSTNVICKHDNTGKWEPNYSNVGGNIVAGAISNLYYPASNSGWGQTITNGLTVTAEGGVGSLFDEFWPDISRKILHRDPTHGLDAQARAQEAAERASRQQQQQQHQGQQQH
jgi:hypothetical protein